MRYSAFMICLDVALLCLVVPVEMVQSAMQVSMSRRRCRWMQELRMVDFGVSDYDWASEAAS